MPVVNAMTTPISDNASIRDAAIHWFLRLREPNRSVEETRAFQAWLEASPVHRREYAALETMWRRLDPGKATGVPEFDATLRRARAFTGARSPKTPAHAQRTHMGSCAAAIAAVVVLAIGAAWWWHALRVTVIPFQTARGEQRTVVLADGTAIDLNTDTAGTARFWRSGREVLLDRGEAYFTVAYDPDRPFEVIVGNGRIQDIGTEFAVRREAERVTVVVISGAVRIDLLSTVEPPVKRGPRLLKPGERISYSPEGSWSVVEQVDTRLAVTWRAGTVMFDGVPLAEAVQEVGRYWPEPVTLADPGLGETRVKGVFTIRNLDEFFVALPTIVPVEVIHLPGHTVITRRSTGSG